MINDTMTELRKVDEKILQEEKPALTHIEVADKIYAENKIIFCAGKFYEYENGYYKPIGEEKIRGWIKDILGPKFRSTIVHETMYALETDAYIETDRMNKTDLLNLKNGLFSTETYELSEHSPEIYSSIQLNVNFNKDARCDKWLKALNEIFEDDEAKISTLQEFYGLCLTKETRYEKALFMLGEGRNGKSTVLYVLENLLGDANRTAIPLEKLDNAHYVANLFGKLCNISVETNAKSEIYDATFKQVVSGDSMTADRKFEQEFTFRPYCKLIYALNNMPRVNDKTIAFYRRLLILRFDKQFTDDIANKNLKYELLDEIDGIFLWALEGLKRLRARGYFAIDPKMQAEIDEFRSENNSVLLFVDEECRLDEELSIAKKDLYLAFQEWCKTNGHRALSHKRFSMELMKQYSKLKSSFSPNKEIRLWDGIDLQLRLRS